MPNEDFTSPHWLTQQNKKKLKEAYKRAHEIRQFERKLYWKRATYFWAFELVALTGLGTLFFKHLEQEGSKQFSGALFLVSLGGTLITLLWLLVLCGSKSWQKNWEKHLDVLEYYFSGNLYKCMFLNGKNPFSSSAASIAIVVVFLFFWNISLIFSFNTLINLIVSSQISIYIYYIVFFTLTAIIIAISTHLLRGSPHKIRRSDFSLTIRYPEILSTSESEIIPGDRAPATSRPSGTAPGSARQQSPSSRYPRRPAGRPRFPARLPRCLPSRSPRRAA